MNEQTAPTLSRRQRFNRQPENQEQPQKEPLPKSHGGLVVLLVLLSLVLLASAPIYGLMKNSPKTVKTAPSSDKTSQSATSSASSQSAAETSAAQSSTSQATTNSSQSQSAAQSSQETQSSDDQAAAAAAASNTATLGTNQTLYNFAVTHGTTTDQIYALNPGVTAQNYSKFAGQALRIK